LEELQRLQDMVEDDGRLKRALLLQGLSLTVGATLFYFPFKWVGINGYFKFCTVGGVAVLIYSWIVRVKRRKMLQGLKPLVGDTIRKTCATSEHLKTLRNPHNNQTASLQVEVVRIATANAQLLVSRQDFKGAREELAKVDRGVEALRLL